MGNHSDEWLKNLPVQSENIAFNAEELILCAKCGRTNPPTRLNCFYCDDELPVSEVHGSFLKPNLRKLEAWEKGFNLIFLSASQISVETAAIEISKLLKLEKETADKIVVSEMALPIVRVESETEATLIQTRLRENGVETSIVSDENLAAEKPPRRLRGIEFHDDRLILILFNQDEIIEVSNGDLALIVSGAVFERKIQAMEKHNKKGENQILETTETASDELLVDVYSRKDSIGYRIWAKGFDFSCLGAEKKLLATENIKILADRLRHISPDAKFVNNYLQIRDSLSSVWEVEQRTDSQGLKRQSFGQFNLGNLTTVNNLSQFTRYSRLQWHLL